MTSLQRDANGRFGFSAKNTLGLAQALYERHKVLTYPRTDSRALPEDYICHRQDDFGDAGRHRHTRPLPSEILRSDWVHPNKRIFNNAKISDHFAIIPTTARPKAFDRAGTKTYTIWSPSGFWPFFIRRRNFWSPRASPASRGSRSRREGKVMVKAGWMEVYGQEAQTG